MENEGKKVGQRDKVEEEAGEGLNPTVAGWLWRWR